MLIQLIDPLIMAGSRARRGRRRRRQEEERRKEGWKEGRQKRRQERGQGRLQLLKIKFFLLIQKPAFWK